MSATEPVEPAWRLILTGPGDAFYNMALDEAIARSTMAADSPPTLRLYAWNSPSVTLGRFQRASEADHGYCARNRIPIVRRPTGGRAILHGPELTYSFSAPGTEPVTQGLMESYAALSAAFLTAFRSLGLDAQAGRTKRARPSLGTNNPLCFSSTSYGEITVKGRKVIGSAQRRWPGGILQQGSIPLEVLKEETHAAFKSEAETLIGLRELKSAITYDSLKDAVIGGFESALKVRLAHGSVTPEEENEAGRLAREKYSTPQWNALR